MATALWWPFSGGGSNYNHVDLVDNHWVNSEIPGNGIDDDNNGSVDDYNGCSSGAMRPAQVGMAHQSAA